MSAARSGAVAASLSVLLSWPTPAAAQRQAFVDGLTDLTSALAGTYGDEGARIGPALDMMDRGRTSIARDTRTGEFRPLPAAGSPILPHAAYAAAYRLMAQGQHEDAIRRFREAAATDPLLTDPAAGTQPMRAAAAAMKQNRLSEARTHLEAALARAPDSSEAHRLLGIVFWAAQQEALSIRHLETAIRVNPRDERSRLALARVHSTAGRYEDAERVLRLTIDDFPESALARWWRGSLYDVLHRVPEARREYELAAAAALAGEGPLYAAIGRLARIEADFEGAVQAFTRQVRVMPQDAAARRQLASAYLEQDRVDEAFAELQAALAIDPRDAEAYAAIGQLHLDAGRHVDAVAALRRALDLKPALAEARYALAASLMRLGRSEEAARELEAFERIQRQALAKQRKEMAEQVLKESAALGSGEGRPR